jgi:hypothetical protein
MIQAKRTFTIRQSQRLHGNTRWIVTCVQSSATTFAAITLTCRWQQRVVPSCACCLTKCCVCFPAVQATCDRLTRTNVRVSRWCRQRCKQRREDSTAATWFGCSVGNKRKLSEWRGKAKGPGVPGTVNELNRFCIDLIRLLCHHCAQQSFGLRLKPRLVAERCCRPARRHGFVFSRELSHERPVKPRVAARVDQLASVLWVTSFVAPARCRAEVALQPRLRLIQRATRGGVRRVPEDQHGIAWHELHERRTRPHLPILRILGTFRELLPNEVRVVAHTMPIRCVEVLPRPKRTAWTYRPTMCTLGPVEVGQRAVCPFLQ